MAFIHKNVNSALLMLIAFISVALVTATLYSVEAFDSINDAYAEQAMRAQALEAELAEKAAMADTLQKKAQLNQEREKALAEMLEKQKQEAAQQQSSNTVTIDATATGSTVQSTSATRTPYNPYRNRYWWYR